MIAVDTNVFIGAIQTYDADVRTAARNAVKSLSKQGEQLLCFPQNLVEFWNGATRPGNAKGLGFTPEQAARYVDRFRRFSDCCRKRRRSFLCGGDSSLIIGSPAFRSMMQGLWQP